MTTPATGIVADRYELKERLGGGARKTVYRAWDRVLTREVALALFPREAVFEGERNLVEWEAQITSSLGEWDTSLVRIYDAKWDETGAYLVLEYMNGGDLAARCRKVWASGNEVPIAEVLRLGFEVCEGIGWLHQSYIIHRDPVVAVEPDVGEDRRP
jgi:eukaryotic-like serine/threonine-protein kinase